MRVYLQSTLDYVSEYGADVAHSALQIRCANCGTVKRIEAFKSPTLHTPRISSLNVLRLTEYIGNFSMEHSECEPPKESE